MPEKSPEPNRMPIPSWVWIVGILLLLLGVQLWASGQFEKPPQISLPELASAIEADTVTKIIIKGNVLEVTMADGSVVGASKEPEASLFETFSYLGVAEEKLRASSIEVEDQSTWQLLQDVAFTVVPLLLLVWIFSRFFRQMQGGSGGVFGFGRSRAKALDGADRPTVTFNDVAGVDEAKEEVQEVVQFLREPERFVQVGARIPAGVLMVGPPGTGKTLLARAIAGEAGVPFFHISGSEFVEMFVGVGASRVRDLFQRAKESAPAIVFVDEIDAVGRQRGAGMGGGNDEREQTLNQILVEMDGFDNKTNLIVIAATNRADVLDPALLRPGRFDRKVIVDLPDVRGREAILKIHSRGKPIASDVSLSDMARLTAGFAGADLESLVNEAAIFAARRNQKTITGLEFQDAFDRIVMGPERKSRVINDAEREMIAYHEAGHATVSFYTVNSDPVQKITIIPRGRAGGYVMTLPDDSMTKPTSYFEDRIAVFLAGRAAEDIIYGVVTTGASSDLQAATQIARNMIMQYGMSRLGLRTFEEQSGSPFLGRDFGMGRNYSEEAAVEIDHEVQKIIDAQYQRAKTIISEHRPRVEKLAKALMEFETLDRPTFEALMNSESSD